MRGSGASGDRWPSSFGIPQAIFWCAGVYLLLHLGIGALVAASPRAAQDIVSLGAVQLLVLGGACYWLLSSHLGQTTSPRPALASVRFFGLDPAPTKSVALGAAVGLCLKFPADGVRALTERYFPTPDVELAAQAELLRHETLGHMLALVLVVSLVGPLLEELFYRGAVFRLLEGSRGTSVAAVFTALAFTLTHASVRDWPALLLVAIGLTWLRSRSGTLWAALGAHITFNSSTLLAMFTDRGQLLDPFQVGPWLVVTGALLTPALIQLVPARAATGGDHA